VITDGWRSYPPATRDLYVHEPLRGASGSDASKLLPGVHKVSSLAKRWLLGTHQGSVDDAHLASYLDEFVRHEALSDRVGCKAPPPGCRSGPVKLRAA